MPEPNSKDWSAGNIEAASFAIIRAEIERDYNLAWRRNSAKLEPVLLRMIHTTADFSWLDTLRVSPDFLDAAVDALKAGAVIVTDTRMAATGIDKTRLGALGGSVACFMADADVAEAAKQGGTTRAVAAMDKAARLASEGRLGERVLFAIGNAPTALLRVVENAASGVLVPAAVIGLPVGFVHVVESKEVLVDAGLAYLTALGRKGGSAVAAAVCNALLRIAAVEA
jgi:precorrin-8X/cobalt-precorrin-8 methylmutase